MSFPQATTGRGDVGIRPILTPVVALGVVTIANYLWMFGGHNIAQPMVVSSEMNKVLAGKLSLRKVEPGQSLVELALILPLFLLMTLVFIQLVLIGAVALAINQAAASCARYAALNNSYSQSTLNTYLQSVASPLINDSYLATIGLSPSAVPRTSGTSVTVTVSYNLIGKLVLGSSFLGIVFPTTISVSQTMVSN